MSRKVSLGEFHIEDLDMMDVEYDENEDIDEFRDRLEGVMSEGLSKLVWYEGEILAAIGYVKFWPGVCEVWAVANSPVKDKGIYALTLKYAIQEFIEPAGFHRMQATVLKGSSSEAFFEKIGFKCEGVLEQYDALKRDYKLWARII